jgi:predicted phage terminase large subunit-like protein
MSLFDSLAARLEEAPEERQYLPTARPKQIPPDDPRHYDEEAGILCGCGQEPDDDWSIWLLMAGRGFGKSKVGSEWLAHQAALNPGSEWAIFAPTFRDTRKTCIEGSTGLLKALQPGELQSYRRNELQIVLNNGSTIYGYSADQPERARGANLWGCWADEVGSWRYEETWHEGMIPALRIGRNPRVVVTTTPRPTRLIRDLVGRRDGSVHVTRGSTWENSDNLSKAALHELRRRYEGTRVGRQELEGELLEDLEGALWRRDSIDENRVGKNDVPDLSRIVVAIDPAVTSDENSDESGIIVIGEANNGHGYVLADRSLKGSPLVVMRLVSRLYHEHRADAVVCEVNNGGDYIGNLLHTVDADIPYRTVRASRGKEIRAEPVASLYEQGRIHHVGLLPELEDQMCTWVPGISASPDRVDALVWGVTELRGLSSGSWAAAYNVVHCPKCERPFIMDKNPDVCPHCRRPHELNAQEAS